ncbi:protein G49 [Common bottlenose dolphin gammaherpesvirus 1 strain Sarasota]|uniref:Protein G49 n=1 Tax=Common bottlenose dolphin gammaherpesvirus 1 strain Sarasota TaxID=2022783 RepID=A0A1Z1NE88_9GAMA|nr:protein G49 [Common bottlenose dolphin gammaherpesvirus 1 strain Sarasota]ARW78111.1 protein G49 [Common bottlenose dolphin gammaherpesvirus 1 strain Sarasota]
MASAGNMPIVTNSTFLNKLFKYHYPRIGAIVDMLHSVDCEVANPVYKEQAVRLSRVLALAKVLQTLVNHQMLEPFIIPRILDILSHYISKMQTHYSGKISAAMAKVAKHIDAHGDDQLEAVLDFALYTSRRAQYTEDDSEWVPITKPIGEWVITNSRGLDDGIRAAVYSNWAYGTGQIPSMAFLATISKRIFLNEELNFTHEEDNYFNTLFNQLILWTAALRVFRMAIHEGALLNVTNQTAGLLVEEMKAFFAWFASGGYEWVSTVAMLDYLFQLVNGLHEKLLDFEVVEIYTLVFNIRQTLVNQED